MNQKESITLFQYWNRLRGHRPAPRRTEVEPADIKTLLADTFILERDQRGEAVFRLAGTRLCATYDRELRGFSFASLWAAGDRPVIDRLSYQVFDAGCVVVITFEGCSRSGRSNPFELLVLPLDGGSDNPRALGALVPCEVPFWLGADPIVENRVETFRAIEPARQSASAEARAAMDVPPLAPLAGALHDTAAEPDHGRRIRHLVVFDGGRNE